MSQEKIFTTIRYIFVVLAILISSACVYAYMASDYYSFLHEFLIKTQRTKDYEPLLRTDPYFHGIYHPFTNKQFDALLKNKTLLFIYSIVKYELILLLCILLFWIHDLVTESKTRVSRWINYLLSGLATSLHQNYRYVSQWDRFTKRSMAILFLLQAVLLLLFLLKIPFEYDEQMSYFCFSSRGFLQTATFYPFPNNHILYNQVATLFAYLPLSPAITTRLPSFLVYFVAEYYLFKLSRRHFSVSIAMLITTLYTISYPILFYAIMARGYTFMHCFTILLFYSADKWMAEPGSRKYRMLYFLSMVGAVYTTPSSVYILAGMGLALASYYIYTRRWRELFRFVADNVQVCVALLLLYLPIVLCNGLSSISNPAGAPRGTVGIIAQIAYPVFQRTWEYFSRGFGVPSFMLIPLIMATLFAGYSKKENTFLAWMTAVVLISPVPILFLHRFVPMERLLGYLMVPICLSAGFLLSLLVAYGKRITRQLNIAAYLLKYREPLTVCGMVILTLSLFANYRYYHYHSRSMVYFADDLFKKMGHDMEQIHSIGYTSDYYSQYYAQCILMQCYMLDPEKKIAMRIRKVDDLNDVEVLLPGARDSVKADQYEFLDAYYFSGHDHVEVYIRKK
jgi:hypothetical protein